MKDTSRNTTGGTREENCRMREKVIKRCSLSDEKCESEKTYLWSSRKAEKEEVRQT